MYKSSLFWHLNLEMLPCLLPVFIFLRLWRLLPWTVVVRNKCVSTQTGLLLLQNCYCRPHLSTWSSPLIVINNDDGVIFTFTLIQREKESEREIIRKILPFIWCVTYSTDWCQYDYQQIIFALNLKMTCCWSPAVWLLWPVNMAVEMKSKRFQTCAALIWLKFLLKVTILCSLFSHRTFLLACRTVSQSAGSLMLCITKL